MTSQPQTPPNVRTISPFKKAVKWLLISFLSVVLLCFILLSGLLSVALFSPNAVKQTLPYLPEWTNGQLSIESSEGRLLDGLRLQNIRFNNPDVHLEIEQVQWQWQLSALFKRQIHFTQLHITKPSMQLMSSDTPVEPTLNRKPFELLTQLDIALSMDAFSVLQASLQFDDQPPVTLNKLSSAIYWQDHTLTLDQTFVDYQTYQLQADSRIHILNAAEFSAQLQLKLIGVEQVPNLQLATEIQGDLQHLKFNLEMSHPYVVRSEHTLTMESSLIQLNSKWHEFHAKLNDQWIIKQLTGNNALRYDSKTQQLSSQGKLNLAFANKAPAAVKYALDYHTKQGKSTFSLNSLFENMGSFTAQGQANTKETTLDVNLYTQDLNLQWLDPSLNYQINSELNAVVSDIETRQAQLNIKQFDLSGLPEAFSFKGRISSQLDPQVKARSNYEVKIQSEALSYAHHTGKLQAKLTSNTAFSIIQINQARLTLGDNQLDLTGQVAEQINVTLTAKLNQLNQLYQPLSGQINLKAHTQGRLRKDSNKIEQAWSDVTVNAQQLRYLAENSASDAQSAPAFHLAQFQASAKIPLHQPEWTQFSWVAKQLKQQSAGQDSLLLFSQFDASRQPDTNGLTSQLKLNHPELTFNVLLLEDQPSFTEQNIRLKRFDIKDQTSGDWHLKQAETIQWKNAQKDPIQIRIPELCLQSVKSDKAKLCVEANTDHASWSLHTLPVFDWLKPWLGQSILLKGKVNGEGSANWKNKLQLQQTLNLEQLDVNLITQGYKIPFVIKNWQTDIKLSDKQTHLKSQAQINETGDLKAQIEMQTKSLGTEADLNGQIRLQINEWPLSKAVLEVVELQHSELNIETHLSGKVSALQHDTQATMALKLNLPLLGLSDQSINLQAKVTPNSVDATGLWQQTEQRQADLQLKLSDLANQPKLMAYFKTESIELLKTPFAHLNSSADMALTWFDGATHIQGQTQLHHSHLNLDAMPLHERTQTSDDEIIINEQGHVVPKSTADSKLSYDVKIAFGEQVKVNIRDAQLFLGGEIQLIKQVDTPDMQAFGKVLLREGYINLDARNQIQVDQSSFQFNGAIGNPALNVNLFRVVNQTTARLNITGNATQPQFVFYSTPSLSQGRIVNLMIFGRAGDSTKEPNYESQVLSALYKLGIQNNTPVLNTLTQSLGIQDVYFDVKNQKVSSLLVGRALTDKLYVRYARDLTGQQGNAVQFFYQLTPKWLLKSDSGDNRSSVDLIYRLER